jgi:hypothetical protein
MFYKKTPGVCDFCMDTQVFNKYGNNFCCGMCMDKYNKCKENKDAKNLFVNLKELQHYKIKINEKLKETDKNIKILQNQIALLTIV